MTDGPPGAGIRRVGAVVAFAARRVLGKARGPGSRRLVLTFLGVAIAVMLMTTVTGIALGLASQSAVQADNVDYWVVPEQGDLATIAVSTDGPRLGTTHQLTDSLRADPRVRYATPVLLQITSIRNGETGDQAHVLLVGVVVPERVRPTIATLPTRPMTGGDPHYANGSYDGTWTGEFVTSPTTAEMLNATPGDELTATARSSTRTFTVTAVSEDDLTTGVGPTPVALVHLSELQTLTGATSGDIADQLLVGTNDPSVRSDLETLYPRTDVVTRTGLASRDVSPTSLPVAMALAAFAVAFAVGVLFTATMMGFEVVHDRRTFAVLAALGYSERSLAVGVAVETLTISLVGGLTGVALGTGGIYLTNAVAAHTLGVSSVALFRPILLLYGLGVALLIGLVSIPYPLWLARRMEVTEVLQS